MSWLKESASSLTRVNRKVAASLHHALGLFPVSSITYKKRYVFKRQNFSEMSIYTHAPPYICTHMHI